MKHFTHITHLVFGLLASSTFVGVTQAQQTAVEWRVQDGGNGHWYGLISPTGAVTWNQARASCEQFGGYLATVPTAEENAFVHSVVGQIEVYLGGFQSPGSCEPGCGWKWLTGEPWGYTNWNTWEPNNSQGNQDYLRSFAGGQWDDVWGDVPIAFGIAIEWDADCNNDGIVDYGQILQGQLNDSNTNGIPDICECGANPTLPACCLGDLSGDHVVDGADIGLLLSSWGFCGATCPHDLNNDGKVNGGDLGLLLSGWGTCGN